MDGSFDVMDPESYHTTYMGRLHFVTTINYNPSHRPGGSSPVEFFVEFNLQDSFSSDDNIMVEYSQGITKSNTLMVEPHDSSSWLWATIELERIGLETEFIPRVVNSLRSRVDRARRHYIPTNGTHSPISVHMDVDINRVRVFPAHQVLLSMPIMMDHDDHDVDDDDEGDELMAIMALKRVNFEGAFCKDNGDCAICLEDVRPVELPCKHVFHDGCIRSWFKNSHFCPICRADVLAST